MCVGRCNYVVYHNTCIFDDSRKYHTSGFNTYCNCHYGNFDEVRLQING